MADAGARQIVVVELTADLVETLFSQQSCYRGLLVVTVLQDQYAAPIQKVRSAGDNHFQRFESAAARG
jgi:hypothetical protein